jgi:archaellum component FlaF (FlaF/FlaG flagellin family)
LSEEAIIQGYLDTHPSLPTGEVSSPADATAVLTVFNQISATATIQDTYPYFSAKSVEMFQKTPNFVNELNAEQSLLYDPAYIYPKVTVLNGQQHALLSNTVKQDLTNYSYNSDAVFVKENGSWKLDFIGTLKRSNDIIKQRNPLDSWVTGSGTTDITITGLEYESESPSVNNSRERFLVRVKNNGQTTVQKFGVDIDINGSDVYNSVLNYQLNPGQEIILSLPIRAYWALNGVNKAPGQYRTDVSVGVTPNSLDTDLGDNSYYDMTNFR